MAFCFQDTSFRNVGGERQSLQYAMKSPNKYENSRRRRQSPTVKALTWEMRKQEQSSTRGDSKLPAFYFPKDGLSHRSKGYDKPGEGHNTFFLAKLSHYSKQNSMFIGQRENKETSCFCVILWLEQSSVRGVASSHPCWPCSLCFLKFTETLMEN